MSLGPIDMAAGGHIRPVTKDGRYPRRSGAVPRPTRSWRRRADRSRAMPYRAGACGGRPGAPHAVSRRCCGLWGVLLPLPAHRKARLESLGRLAPAQKTGPVTCGQGRRLIEKEKLSPTSRTHEGAAHTAPLKRADEPGPTGPTARQQRAGPWVMDDTAIARKMASLGRCNDITQRG
jgi:hypothetical protein